MSKSKVFDYVINPYIGCQHGCTYCYARFMKRFTGHREPWGDFVDIKINASDLLQKEITRKPQGRVWVSGLCDAYQPLEQRYELTRKCIELLVRYDWPVTIQTKSPLVLRDMKLLMRSTKIEVGLTVTTAVETVRKLFEPYAPPVKERIKALEELHLSGVRTYAMIAPILPEAEELVAMLRGKVDYILIDRMNYRYADWVYKRHKLESALSDDFFFLKGRGLASAFEKQGIECRVLF